MHPSLDLKYPDFKGKDRNEARTHTHTHTYIYAHSADRVTRSHLLLEDTAVADSHLRRSTPREESWFQSYGQSRLASLALRFLPPANRNSVLGGKCPTPVLISHFSCDTAKTLSASFARATTRFCRMTAAGRLHCPTVNALREFMAAWSVYRAMFQCSQSTILALAL